MRRGSRGEEGFTIIEVVVAAAVLALGLMGLLSAIPGGLKLMQTSRETQIALTAIRSKIEELRAADFDTLFDIYHGQPMIAYEDKDGDGGFTPGFSEELLPLVPTMTRHGLVLFLDEPGAAQAWGVGAMDLNADGDGLDAPPNGGGGAPFQAYAVSITMSWQAETGTRTLKLVDMVYKRED